MEHASASFSLTRLRKRDFLCAELQMRPKETGHTLARNGLPNPAGYVPHPATRHTFPPDSSLPLKPHGQVPPAEGSTHLCNPFRSSEGGPGPLGRYTDSCREC